MQSPLQKQKNNSISLIGIGETHSCVLYEISLGEEYRQYSACAFHKKTKTLYILGGQASKNIWVGVC